MPVYLLPLIRRKRIVKHLKACGAISPETAKTLSEAGVRNPDGFKRITERLVKRGIIKKAEGDRYYL